MIITKRFPLVGVVDPAFQIHPAPAARCVAERNADLSEGTKARDEHPQHDEDRPSDHRYDGHQNWAVIVHERPSPLKITRRVLQFASAGNRFSRRAWRSDA